MINSPLNYSGNKYRVVKEILNFIPDEVNQFVEIFAGSAIVALNSHAQEIILNDVSSHTIDLLRYFIENTGDEIISAMDAIIKWYHFTDSYRNGLHSYKEEKHEGLSLYNKKAFQRLKDDYNKNPSVDKLFALNIFGFNHYLRFNQSGLFNVPVGKVDYTLSLREKTILYSKAFKEKKVELSSLDFRNPELYRYEGENVLYYFDPPYLITNAPYNACWSLEDEKALLHILDSLEERGIKFALSNVFQSNGKENILLKEWAVKYNVHYIHRQYRNANYRRKNVTDTVEVLITNY